MGSYAGAEICELVGLYILQKLRDNNIEAITYRDDAAVIDYKMPRANQQQVSKIQQIFREVDLSITIKANLSVLDFLDVTLDLTKSEYRPYHKPNNQPIYVHKDSNHPASVIKQIPLTVQRRISDLSSNKEVFDREKAFFEDALKRSGYDVSLQYTPSDTQAKKGRSRKVIWFNPPFCKSVKTRIGAKFLELINTCFPKNHTLSKIINRNTIKVSPCCLNNVNSIISGQNKSKLCDNPLVNDPTENCTKQK